MNYHPTPETFRSLGFEIVHRNPRGVAPRSRATEMKEFRALFGTWWTICAIMWRMIRDHCPQYLTQSARPLHLLWALAHMKLDISQEVIARAICDTNPKTFGKWAWHFIDAISYLEGAVIIWQNRLLGDIGMDAKTSIDGIHFSSYERRPFWNGNYSHKFNGPGYSYETCLCIQTGHIVSIEGPHRAGKPDSEIFRSGTLLELEDGEMCEGDTHYKKNVPERFRTWPAGSERAKMAAKVEARHETVHRRIRDFGMMQNRWRHGMERHSSAFRAAVVITQLHIENGEPLFAVEYR